MIAAAAPAPMPAEPQSKPSSIVRMTVRAGPAARDWLDAGRLAVQPDAARELGERKAANVLATGAEIYASANPGCLLQVSAALRRAGRPLPAVHPVELLDASIRRVQPPRRGL